MILALIFVILGLLALLLIVFSAKGQFTTGNLDELAAQLRPVDINAFRNLVAVSEQQYLRDHLPPREFRAIHRQRMLAATGYIRCAAQNAAILIRLGEAARQNSDPAVVATAEKLLENAVPPAPLCFSSGSSTLSGDDFPANRQLARPAC